MQPETLPPFRVRTRWIVAGLFLFVLAFDSWEAHSGLWRLTMGYAYVIIFMHLLMDVVRRVPQEPSDPAKPGTLDPFLWERKLQPWSLACVFFAAVMMANFWACRWMLPIQTEEIPVERRTCTKSRVLVHNGQGCFSTRGWVDHGWYLSRADLWTIDVDLIEGDIPAGGKAILTQQTLERSWLNWGNYIRIVSVR